MSGGLFENFDDDREMAFRYAVDRINADDSMLPNSRLSAKIERLKPQSSFYAAKSGTRYYYIDRFDKHTSDVQFSSGIIRSITTAHVWGQLSVLHLTSI